MRNYKIHSIIFVMLILIITVFSACGKSEEEIQKEKVSVDRALKGGWITQEEAESDVFKQLYGDPYYGVLFENGTYQFLTLSGKNQSVIHSEEGTYIIYVESKEIVCTTNDGAVQQRTFNYIFENNNLTLTDSSNHEYTKMN